MNALIAPTLEQTRQVIFTSLLSTGNLKIIGLVFLVSLAILYFLKFIKSLLMKILMALLIAAIFTFYLYLKIGASIRF